MKKNSRARDNTPTIANMPCLPLREVSAYFSNVLTESHSDLAFLLVFLTTGLNPSREIYVADSLPLPDDRIILDPSEGTLIYRIIRGATSNGLDDSDPELSNKIMRLALPRAIADSLSHSLKFETSKKIIARLNRHAYTYACDHPGYTPTVKRLSITGRTRFLLTNMSDVEAATISGAFHTRNGASGCYVGLDTRLLNDRYRVAFGNFVTKISRDCSPDLSDHIKSLRFDEPARSKSVGSRVKITLEDVHFAISEIEKKAMELHERYTFTCPSKSLPLRIEYLNLQNCYLYVLQLFGLSCRPIGDQSLLLYSGEEFFIGDKNSADYLEISYSPACKILIDQMKACEADLLDFTKSLSHDRRPYTQGPDMHVARYITQEPSSEEIIIQRMCHRDFIHILNTHTLCSDSVLTSKNNASRHFNGTFHLDLPIPLRKEMMGHKVDGADYTGAWSSATHAGLLQLNTAIEKVISALSLQPLAFSDRKFTPLRAFFIDKKNPSKKDVRESILPDRIRDLMDLPKIRKMHEYLWNTWLSHPRTREELEFACLITMAFEDGVPHDFLEALATRTNHDIDPDGAIRLPIWADDIGAARHLWKPRCAARTLLLAIVLKSADDALLFSILEPEPERTTQRYKKLQIEFRKFKKDFTRDTGITSPRLRTIFTASQWLAWKDGVEATYLSLLTQKPFPRDAEWTRYYPDHPHAIAPHGILFTPIHHPTRKSAVMMPRPMPLSEWQENATEILRDLLNELKGIAPAYFDTERRRREADIAFSNSLKKADLLGTSTSALHLSIRWVAHKINITNGAIKVSSLNTYLERVVFNGLFTSEHASLDLLDWESEDFQSLVESRLHSKQAPKTLTDTLCNFVEILDFAMDSGFSTEIDLSEFSVKRKGPPCSLIPALIQPHELDVCLQDCLAEGTRESLLQGAAIALMGYGTARVIDLSHLSLADVYGDVELFCEIHISKTKGGRRRIPLNTFASPVAIEVVQRYLLLRRSEFSDLETRPLHKMSFFGEIADTEQLSCAQISVHITRRLRPIFGQGFSSYLLRHAAVTWLFVRLEILREPRLLEKLPALNAPIFQREALSRFARLFSNGAADTLLPWDPSYFYQLAIFCGHRHPCSTFHFYIHAVGLVQNLRVDLIDADHGLRRLAPRVIAQLAPRARIPASHRHLPPDSLLARCAALTHQRRRRR